MTKEEIEAQIKRISNHVEKILMREHFNYGISHLVGVYDSKQHIINIGTSILCTKYNIGYPGGSFVQAVVNNNLMESFMRADTINKQCINFYCALLYNTRYEDIE